MKTRTITIRVPVLQLRWPTWNFWMVLVCYFAGMLFLGKTELWQAIGVALSFTLSGGAIADASWRKRWKRGELTQVPT